MQKYWKMTQALYISTPVYEKACPIRYRTPAHRFKRKDPEKTVGRWVKPYIQLTTVPDFSSKLKNIVDFYSRKIISWVLSEKLEVASMYQEKKMSYI